jgi:hypothetical protein
MLRLPHLSWQPGRAIPASAGRRVVLISIVVVRKSNQHVGERQDIMTAGLLSLLMK